VAAHAFSGTNIDSMHRQNVYKTLNQLLSHKVEMSAKTYSPLKLPSKFVLQLESKDYQLVEIA